MSYSGFTATRNRSKKPDPEISIYMHRESGTDSEVDPIVKVDLVQSLHQILYHNFSHKFDHTCGLGAQGKLSRRIGCDGGGRGGGRGGGSQT